MYLEGMEEASIFVHIAINDISGKVGITEFLLHKFILWDRPVMA